MNPQYSASLGAAANHHFAGSLREAITALYTQDHIIQHPADAWLQRFRASPGSWRLCLELLETPHLQEHECYFAANNIKAACQRHQDVLEPGLLHELLAKIAVHMQSCIHKDRWATSQQLASAAATVAVRATAIHPSILQDLQSVFIPSAAAIAAAHSSEQYLLAAAPSVYGVQQTVVRSHRFGLQLQQDPALLAAMLLVLAALPDAVLSKQTSVHPDRRTAVTDSLKQSISAAPVLRAAICSRNPKLITLACQAVISWCDLGCPPRGLEAHADWLDALSTALLGRETAVPSCDAVAAVLTAVKESCRGCSNSSSNSSMQLLHQLAQQLQVNVLPAVAAEHHNLVGASAAASSCPAADTAPFSAVLRSHLGSEAEVAFCRVLCAAAAATLQPVLQGAVQYQPLLEVLLQQLLLSVCVSDDGIAMMAVAFWQDCYILSLQALPLEQQGSLLLLQQGVLQALAEALVQRTQLNPAAAASATADARDLPEEMRMVRREIASALRDISSLLGQQPMLSYVTQIISAHYQHLCSTHTANNSTHSSSLDSTAVGLDGTTASVTGSSWNLSPAPETQHMSQHQCTSSNIAVPGHTIPAAGRGPAVTSSPAVDWVSLESALYAANVVLGRQGGEAAEAPVQQLVQCTAAAVVHAGGSMKLAGTALTLLGGLAAWLATHQASLPAVLTAAVAALQSPDEKLSRNAATCVQRLCSWDGLARVITQSHGQFVQQLMQEYQRRGGLSSKRAEGSEDKPTEELLLLSLCSLAVAHTTNNSDMHGILLQLVGPQLTAAADELVAALHGRWPQQQQQVPAVRASYLHQKQTQHLAPHHLQQPVLRSTAITCFMALTSLVNGLPTGIDKQALGLPVHGRHPMHQQQMLRQRQQQATTHGSHHLAKVVGLQRCGASADDASMGSQSASELSSSTTLQPATAAAVVPCQTQCSHAHCQAPQQQQQQQRTQGPVAQQRQHQACFIVSQLLAAASQPVLLAMQAAAKAAGEDQVLCQLFAKQLLSAVCSFLLVAFPAAVQHQLENDRAPAAAAVRPAAEQIHAGICHKSQKNCQDDHSTSSSCGNALQAGVLLQQLCQLLRQLPVDLLQQTCCLQLTCIAVAAAAAAGALPSQECTAGGSNQYLTSQPSVPAAETTAAETTSSQQQLLQVLQDLTKQALGAAATAILQQKGSADPDHTSAALALATVSVQQCPAVLASSDLPQLLVLALSATRTYHLKQCTAVLEWIQVLLQTAYSQQKQLHSRSECGLSGYQVSSSVSSRSGSGCIVLKSLRECLESSTGPQLVLALLLAASGAMPPDVVLPISFCLHSVWLAVGQTVFVSWLTAAVVHMAPESAPWSKQRHVAKVGFVSELTDAACLMDTTRFKRILKNFCGGKKKGH